MAAGRASETGLLYCEEPLPVEWIRARGCPARRQSPADHCRRQRAHGARSAPRTPELNTFDILNIKTPRTGYTESLAMAASGGNGRGIMVGSQAGSAIGTARRALLPPVRDRPSFGAFLLSQIEGRYLHDCAAHRRWRVGAGGRGRTAHRPGGAARDARTCTMSRRRPFAATRRS